MKTNIQNTHQKTITTSKTSPPSLQLSVYPYPQDSASFSLFLGFPTWISKLCAKIPFHIQIPNNV